MIAGESDGTGRGDTGTEEILAIIGIGDPGGSDLRPCLGDRIVLVEEPRGIKSRTKGTASPTSAGISIRGGSIGVVELALILSALLPDIGRTTLTKLILIVRPAHDVLEGDGR